MSHTTDCRALLRRKGYKHAVDAAEARRKREDNLIQIRKIKREDNLLKKRREGTKHPQQQQCYTILQSFHEMVAAVWSDNPSLRLRATTQLRELISHDKNLHLINPLTDQVINAGVVPRFVEFLTEYNAPEIQYEAAWALTNIASGTSEHTRVVIDHGALPRLVHLLLNSPRSDVREQAVWALGNIAGDSIQCRDLVIDHGVLNPLLAQLNEQATLSMVRTVSWALSNMCRGKPQVCFQQLMPALPALRHLLHLSDEYILAQACWALSDLAVGNTTNIKTVIDLGFCSRIVELLLHPSHSVVIPALRTVGNILTGNEKQTQLMINNQVLPCLLMIIRNSPNKSLKKSACWAVSNVTAGTKAHIQAVIDANIIPALVQLLGTGEFSIKEEAAWAICNAASGCSHIQIKYLVEEGFISSLCDLLDCSNPELVNVCLDALKSILELGETEKELGNSVDMNPYVLYIEDAGGFGKIEILLNHKQSDIYKKAADILEYYWSQDC